MLRKINYLGVSPLQKPTLNAAALEEGMDYIIMSIKLIETKFGKKLIVEFEDCNHFLPKRYNERAKELMLMKPGEYKLNIKRNTNEDGTSEIRYIFWPMEPWDSEFNV